MNKFNCTGAIYATGRRKTASAKVWLKPGSGKVFIKRGAEYVSAEEMFPMPITRACIFAPFKIVDNNDFDIICAAYGGGSTGQAQAICHGISRALDKYNNETYHSLLKGAGLLTRDSRQVQEKMPGGKKARARKQRSKR